MTLKQFLLKEHTPQTTDSYLRAIEKFKLHQRNHEKATYQDVVLYLDGVKTSKGRILAAIKKYYDYLIFVELREDHPCENLVAKRKKSAIQHQDLFSSEELEMLLDRESRYQNLKSRNQCIISLLIYQGLTSENIVNLRIQDLDLDEATIYIKATTNLHRRTLELQAKQMKFFYKYVLEDRLNLSSSEPSKLFISKLGQPLTADGLNRLLRPLKSMFPAKNLNTKTIRQSVISNWLNEQGKSLEETQQLSGQKWLSTTEKYKIENRQEKKDLLERVHPL